MLTEEYELFQMEDGENIEFIFERLLIAITYQPKLQFIILNHPISVTSGVNRVVP